MHLLPTQQVQKQMEQFFGKSQLLRSFNHVLLKLLSFTGSQI